MEYTEQQLKDMNTLFNYHNAKPNKQKMILKTIEELSSLNKLLPKLLLEEIKPHDIELLDEIFDTEFMMFQLKRRILNNSYLETLYINIVNAKLERELKRWGIT